ncbi:hypothetical protein HHK36_022224 [Tetracentron sinense]|uniref:BHLH domain-containing protein n=1 Tax=Tetracentron sinense TaxID=13715 RepID=A0A834YMK6_TETSI|nr:hypothetical protein HHK36_022224 [Tetracentron sinense]
MEKENFSNSGSLPILSYGNGASSSSPPPTWKSTSSGMEVRASELNCSSEQLPNCFLNLNWENSMDQSVPFESSALSSIVSSPAASNAAVPSEKVVIRELIGKLGSICNSGDKNSTRDSSCYSTPLNSPPKLNLSRMDHQVRGNFPNLGNQIPSNATLALFSADPGFAERAARFSCFGNRSFSGLTSQFGIESEFSYRSNPRFENGKLPKVSIQDELDAEMISASASASGTKFSGLSRSSTPENAEFGNSHEESSVSEQIPVGEVSLKGSNEVNTRKRKAIARGKSKDAKVVVSENDESNGKKGKLAEDNGNEKDDLKAKEDPNGSLDQKQSKDNPKPPEPPRDYIHVRARRGQATDSHSLAERVRREKISKRMKFLQDLVPGCNKITGKAVMLDEIINYVESLQRQVEFLSMKLATVNPMQDLNMETLLSKDILQPRGSLRHTTYPLDPSVLSFPYTHQAQQGPLLQNGISSGTETQCSVNPFDAALRRNLNMQFPPVDGISEAASQLTTFWGDDLQSIVQMGFDQNQSREMAFQSQSFHGSLPPHMKIEL